MSYKFFEYATAALTVLALVAVVFAFFQLGQASGWSALFGLSAIS